MTIFSEEYVKFYKTAQAFEMALLKEAKDKANAERVWQQGRR